MNMPAQHLFDGLKQWDADEWVQPHRVHRSIYTDRAIFAVEQERIFQRAWVYVGHESELPAPGDHILAHMGTQEIVWCAKPMAAWPRLKTAAATAVPAWWCSPKAMHASSPARTTPGRFSSTASCKPCPCPKAMGTAPPRPIKA
jgi:hypothetical protein